MHMVWYVQVTNIFSASSLIGVNRRQNSATAAIAVTLGLRELVSNVRHRVDTYAIPVVHISHGDVQCSQVVLDVFAEPLGQRGAHRRDNGRHGSLEVRLERRSTPAQDDEFGVRLKRVVVDADTGETRLNITLERRLHEDEVREASVVERMDVT